MKENIAAREVEVEELEMIDLGSALEETREWHPIQSAKDSPTTWGYLFYE